MTPHFRRELAMQATENRNQRIFGWGLVALGVVCFLIVVL